MSEQVFTIQEVAERLRIHHTTVRRMIDRGELAAFKTGRIWRVKLADIEHLMQSKKP